MKAHLTLEGDKLIATLGNGVRLIASDSEEMIPQLITAAVTADELTATAWDIDIDKAPTSGQIIAIKYALIKAINKN